MAITIYGADWCHDTQHTRKHLDRLGLAYQYIDVEQDESAAQWVKARNDGKEQKPTVDINGEVLSVPTNVELDRVLRAHGLLS